MKLQVPSLFFVATAALTQLKAMDGAPIYSSSNSLDFDRRTLIGDETTVNNVADNSVGKKTHRFDHNGNSEVRKGLFFDGSLLDKRSASKADSASQSVSANRRDLLGDLFGGDSTSISNVNDNSQHSQTMSQHDNRNARIHKTNAKQTIGRRSLLEDLFGGDSTSIENVNDNSQHKKTVNQHDNTHTTITKIHRESRGGQHGDGGMTPEEFFELRDDDDHSDLTRRGLLWGGQSMTISNVNDNSKDTKTYNSFGNKDTRISKTDQYRSSSGRRHRGKRAVVGDDKEPRMERRGLLFGGDSMTISNVNDNSKNTKTYSSHGNRSKKITETRTRHDQAMAHDDEDTDWFSKREDEAPISMMRTTVQFEQESQAQEQEKKVVLGPRNLVTIQIVTQNTNGQNIDNSRIFSVKQQAQQQHQRGKKSATGSRTKTSHHPHNTMQQHHKQSTSKKIKKHH